MSEEIRFPVPSWVAIRYHPNRDQLYAVIESRPFPTPEEAQQEAFIFMRSVLAAVDDLSGRYGKNKATEAELAFAEALARYFGKRD